MLKIGILGAMLEEVSFIKNKMQINNVHEIGGRQYFEGQLHGIDTVLVFSRWGKVASSSTVTTLINHFGANLVFFTGVAGAVSKELNIGDIVISEALYQHDMDARPLFKRHQIPLTNQILFKTNEHYREITKKSAHNFLQKIKTEIPENTLSLFSISSPKVYVGLIASGDQFITNADVHDSLKFEGENVMAVEMEGAAVAQVCEEHSIPYIIIRTISDTADHSAVINFQEFIIEIAARYSEGIVSMIYQQINS